MSPELSTIASILAVAAVVAFVLATAFVVGMRTKSSLVLRPLFWFSRRFVNPRQLRLAGRPGAYASIVRHRGRRTGRMHETPVGVVATEDGFLIALPYGTKAQWLRNVLAAGEATLVTEGRTHRVDRPELIPMTLVAGRFSKSDQRLFRLLATRDCLRLRPAVAAAEALEPLAA